MPVGKFREPWVESSQNRIFVKGKGHFILIPQDTQGGVSTHLISQISQSMCLGTPKCQCPLAYCVPSSNLPLKTQDAALPCRMLTPAHLRLTGMPRTGQSTLTARATQDHLELIHEHPKKEEREAVRDREEVKMARRKEKNSAHLQLYRPF